MLQIEPGRRSGSRLVLHVQHSKPCPSPPGCKGASKSALISIEGRAREEDARSDGNLGPASEQERLPAPCGRGISSPGQGARKILLTLAVQVERERRRRPCAGGSQLARVLFGASEVPRNSYLPWRGAHTPSTPGAVYMAGRYARSSGWYGVCPVASALADRPRGTCQDPENREEKTR